MTAESYTWFDPAGRKPEQARLQRQAALYDPITLRVLDAAGIAEGMRVLELGSGAGDVSILLSQIVGETGAVVGVERDPDAVVSARRRIHAAGIGNVELVEGDVATLDLTGGFDAMVGRLILMYLFDPAAALGRVARLVAPGGIVCMLEISWDRLAVPETPLFARIAQVIGDAFRCTGAHVDMGNRLHATFRAAGLTAPELILERPAGGAERPLSQYLRDELIGLTPLLERERLITPDELDLDTLITRLDADTDQTGGIVTLWPMVGAWARVGSGRRA